MYPIKEHSITQTYKSFHAITLKDAWENAFFVLMDNWLRCTLVENGPAVPRPFQVQRSKSCSKCKLGVTKGCSVGGGATWHQVPDPDWQNLPVTKLSLCACYNSTVACFQTQPESTTKNREHGSLFMKMIQNKRDEYMLGCKTSPAAGGCLCGTGCYLQATLPPFLHSTYLQVLQCAMCGTLSCTWYSAM